MTTFLLDTHVLIWAAGEPERLSGRVGSILADQSTDLIVSAASAWEIATKFRLGKLPQAATLVERWDEVVKQLRASATPIDSAQARRAGLFEVAHRDPFDRLLAAQAELLNCPIITIDAAFNQFPVTTIW